MSKIAVRLMPFVLLAACAHDPARNVQSSGQQLWVDIKDQAYSYTVKEKVGEATHRDAAGNVVGTTEITRDAVRTRRFKVWTFYQGDQPLDELDFFRLAGDEDAVNRLTARRSKGMMYNRIGLGLLGVGLLGLGATAYGQSNVTVGKIGYVLIWGLPVGGIMAYYGKAMVERRYFPLNRALDAIAPGQE